MSMIVHQTAFSHLSKMLMAVLASAVPASPFLQVCCPECIVLCVFVLWRKKEHEKRMCPWPWQNSAPHAYGVSVVRQGESEAVCSSCKFWRQCCELCACEGHTALCSGVGTAALTCEKILHVVLCCSVFLLLERQSFCVSC